MLSSSTQYDPANLKFIHALSGVVNLGTTTKSCKVISFPVTTSAISELHKKRGLFKTNQDFNIHEENCSIGPRWLFIFLKVSNSIECSPPDSYYKQIEQHLW